MRLRVTRDFRVIADGVRRWRKPRQEEILVEAGVIRHWRKSRNGR